ncbi:MAG TPA: XdhC family protein, partial [Longimicrobiales bacterium]
MDALAAARAIEAAHAQGNELVTITVTSGQAAGQRYTSSERGVLTGSLDDTLDVQARSLADEVWAGRGALYAEPLFAELHAVAEPLLVFGAGHIAVPFANLARDLGFDVTVLDDREDFAQPARFHDDIAVRHLDLQAPLRDLQLTERTFVVM